MKEPIKLHVIGTAGNYANWFPNAIVHNIAEAELVMFTGGVDVNPAIYGRQRHPTTQTSNNTRDQIEASAFDQAMKLGKPMVGICRGAQLLCALNGGILVQDMHHPPFHWIKTNDGLSLWVSSDHHQRAFPFLPECKHKLLGWAEGVSTFSEGEDYGDKIPSKEEAEIVYYPESKSLGIQSHPEWQYPCKDEKDQHTLIYLRSLLRKLIDGTI